MDEVKRGENETLRWKPEMHSETGNTEVKRCEIGFDSKPISEMHCKGGTYLKLGVGGGNCAKKGESREGQGETNDRRQRKLRQFFLNSKSTSKIGFEQVHNCERFTVNSASSRIGVRQSSVTNFSKSGERLFLTESESKPKFLCSKPISKICFEQVRDCSRLTLY